MQRFVPPVNIKAVAVMPFADRAGCKKQEGQQQVMKTFHSDKNT
jgi:hypothetical protein